LAALRGTDDSTTLDDLDKNFNVLLSADEYFQECASDKAICLARICHIRNTSDMAGSVAEVTSRFEEHDAALDLLAKLAKSVTTSSTQILANITAVKKAKIAEEKATRHDLTLTSASVSVKSPESVSLSVTVRAQLLIEFTLKWHTQAQKAEAERLKKQKQKDMQKLEKLEEAKKKLTELTPKV
jgi:uncharacterized protein YfcZ (UPF0381/DUF406 family)